MSEQPWRGMALCRTADPDLFFHPDEERGTARRIRQQRARQVCSECPVLEACRAFALDSQQHYGIWGGLTEEDRRKHQRYVHRWSCPGESNPRPIHYE